MHKTDLSTLNDHLEKIVVARKFSKQHSLNATTPSESSMCTQVPQIYYEMQQDIHLAEAVEIGKKMAIKSVKVG